MRCWRDLLTVAMVAVIAGCAGSHYNHGRSLLAREDYAGAAEALRSALAADPENTQIHLDLADALYHQDELDEAEEYLDQARTLDPANSTVALLQGLIHEKRGDTLAAIAEYGTYSRMSRLSPARKVIKARLDRLIRERIRQETLQAVAREELLDVAEIPENTVAVASFQNLGANRSLDPLQKGLAEMMVTDLSKVPGLQVVERLRMQEMMKEIGLGMTGAVDAATAPRLGRLLGASKVVNGSFTNLAEEQLRLDITTVAIKTAIVDGSEVQGPLEKLFRLQKELTFGLIESMGIVLTDEQQEAIQEIPTENLLAFIAYSKGLDLEDRGQFDQAAEVFQEAIELDPQLDAALEGIERMEGVGLGIGDISEVEERVFEERTAEAETPPEVEGATEVAASLPSETLDRLAATGANAGAGFIPTGETGESEVREAVEEQPEEQAKVDFSGVKAQIPIEVVLPSDD